MGDAKSLQGGTLLVTPLQGADGEVYAVSQVPSIRFQRVRSQRFEVTKGVPTSGRITDGAIVEREIAFHLSDLGTMRLSLRNPDFTTSERVADVINEHIESADCQGDRFRRPSSCRFPREAAPISSVYDRYRTIESRAG